MDLRDRLAERRQRKGSESAGRLRFTAPPKTGAPQRPQTVKRGDKMVDVKMRRDELRRR